MHCEDPGQVLLTTLTMARYIETKPGEDEGVPAFPMYHVAGVLEDLDTLNSRITSRLKTLLKPSTRC
jgi:hypothetical protein